MTTPPEPTPHEPSSSPVPPGPAPDPAGAPVDLTKPRGPEPSAGHAPAPSAGQHPAGTPGPVAAYPPGAGHPAGAGYPAAPGQPYGPYPGYAPAYAYPKNQLAVWSLVLGILGIVMGCVFVTGIPAVIVGNNAKRAAAAGEADNYGMAQAGVVLGWVSIGMGVVAIGFVALYFTAVAGVLGLSFLTLPSGS